MAQIKSTIIFNGNETPREMAQKLVDMQREVSRRLSDIEEKQADIDERLSDIED